MPRIICSLRSISVMLVLLASLIACGPIAKEPVAAPRPSPSSTRPPPETQRLWISERDGEREVIGWIQPSPTRIAIEYDLQMTPTPDFLIMRSRFPDDDLFAQSGPVHHERVRRGYLTINDGPDDDLPVFTHPKAFELVVFFKGGGQLEARLRNEPPRT